MVFLVFFTINNNFRLRRVEQNLKLLTSMLSIHLKYLKAVVVENVISLQRKEMETYISFLLNMTLLKLQLIRNLLL